MHAMNDRAALAEAIFRPRAIALIGATADQTKNNARAQRVLQKNGYGGRILPINCVHDALYIDCPSEYINKAAQILKECMMATTNVVHQLFKFRAKIQVPAVISIGPSMGQSEEI